MTNIDMLQRVYHMGSDIEFELARLLPLHDNIKVERDKLSNLLNEVHVHIRAVVDEVPL